ncbi:MAG: M28 family peptidase [Verrucomicrobiales bacterium]|nr:M28 family peptidase [Verrucomicrobiales bacterium]
MNWRWCIPALGFLFLTAEGAPPATPSANPDLPRMAAANLLARTRTLADDEFEGRAPGSRGEELATRWIAEQFAVAGLSPGGTDGTWFQKVPMVGLRSAVTAGFTLGDRKDVWTSPQDLVAWTPSPEARGGVTNSELVFVGYGVVAPEYGWDDFKGVDVRGKTVVMLVNDPPVPDPSDPAALDSRMFRGKAMTYYGRWTYKFESAALRGAAGALVVHETGPAGYPWFVVVNSWARENFQLEQVEGPRVDVAGWLSLEATRRLFAAAGEDFDVLKRRAVERTFRPVPLRARADIQITNELRRIVSRNVVGIRAGSDPVLANDWVVYTAHWDHLGKDPRLDGDGIFNGALDNASGTAGLIGIAEEFGRLTEPTKRSVMFLALTGEEQGLLGARFYATHPLHPLRRTVANLNLDGLNPWGRTRDVAVVGLGNSTLDDLAIREAERQGRVVTSEPMPEKGMFYRSDHFEFAKVGVPALYLKSGLDYLGRPPGWGKAQADVFTERDYHKVSDEVKDGWDFAGAVEDLQILFRIGLELSQGPVWPEWKPGTEFKAVRDAMMREPASGRP